MFCKGIPFLFQQGLSIKFYFFFFFFFFTAPVSKGVDDDLSAYIPGKISICLEISNTCVETFFLCFKRWNDYYRIIKVISFFVGGGGGGKRRHRYMVSNLLTIVWAACDVVFVRA